MGFYLSLDFLKIVNLRCPSLDPWLGSAPTVKVETPLTPPD